MVATSGDGGGDGGAKPTSYDIARSLIRKLGGNPNNTALVRAVAIWMRFETGSTITGNNPWNIRGKGPCGGHYFGSNGPFKTYCSLDQGLTDTARLLSISSYGYPKIKAAVVAGDARGFLVAVYTSKWCHSATQTYCYNNGRSLLNAFAGSLSYNWTPSYRNGSPGSVSGGGNAIPASTGTPAFQTVDLRTWVQGILGPDATSDHVITAQDVDKLFIDVKARFDALGDFPGKDAALAGVSTGLATMIGKKVSDLSGNITLPARPAGDQGGPLEAIAGALGGIGDIFAFLLDAENWFYMGMLAAGVVITAWSFRNLFGAEIGRARPATIITEAVTERQAEGKTLTKTRSKTA